MVQGMPEVKHRADESTLRRLWRLGAFRAAVPASFLRPLLPRPPPAGAVGCPWRACKRRGYLKTFGGAANESGPQHAAGKRISDVAGTMPTAGNRQSAFVRIGGSGPGGMAPAHPPTSADPPAPQHPVATPLYTVRPKGYALFSSKKGGHVPR